jgi:hypothetical protein
VPQKRSREQSAAAVDTESISPALPVCACVVQSVLPCCARQGTARFLWRRLSPSQVRAAQRGKATPPSHPSLSALLCYFVFISHRFIADARRRVARVGSAAAIPKNKRRQRKYHKQRRSTTIIESIYKEAVQHSVGHSGRCRFRCRQRGGEGERKMGEGNTTQRKQAAAAAA